MIYPREAMVNCRDGTLACLKVVGIVKNLLSLFVKERLDLVFSMCYNRSKNSDPIIF